MVNLMNFDEATKKQLLTIALHDDCPLEFKYKACVELQLKNWGPTFLQKLLKYWGMGLSENQIADKFGVEDWEVKKQLLKYNLYGSRVKRRNGA
ncbi:hypothetical protein QF028_004389 [Neobacillus sp. B4I6]